MKRFEFCYRGTDDRIYFAIFYDDDILSACERFLFRPVTGAELNQSPNGNYFIRGWNTEQVSVKETTGEVSGTFSLGEREVETPTPTFALNLEGLDLSKVSQ